MNLARMNSKNKNLTISRTKKNIIDFLFNNLFMYATIIYNAFIVDFGYNIERFYYNVVFTIAKLSDDEYILLLFFF